MRRQQPRVKPLFISAFAYDGGKSGIAEYINHLCLYLSQNNEISIAVSHQDQPLLAKKLQKNSHHIHYIIAPRCCAKPLINILWHSLILPLFTPWKNYRAALLPAGNRRLFIRYPLPTVTTVHDLAQYHINGKYDRFRTFYIKKLLPILIRNVHYVVTVSYRSRDDIRHYWHVDDGKIRVLYNGYDPLRFQAQPPSNLLTVKNKYGLHKSFILYISRMEHPGKNHVRLIEAYEKLPASIQQQYALVFAGSPWRQANIIQDKIDASQYRSDIKTLGFIAADELPALYHLCSLHVMPSLYEGFGIPVIEAFACATPTICSANTALSEIGGDAVLTFNPYKTEDISSMISKVLQAPALQQRMITKGLQRCSLFNWQQHCDEMLKLIEPQKQCRRPP